MSAPSIVPVISHIALKVTDLQRSTQFYAGVLGLPPIPEPFRQGRHSWFSLGPYCQLHLISGGTAIPAFHIDHHLALSTPALDHFIERLQQQGVAFYDATKKPGQVHLRPDGVRQVFFQDPDGYWLELNDEGKNGATKKAGV